MVLPADDESISPWLANLFSWFNFHRATGGEAENTQRRVDALRPRWANVDWQDLEYQAKYVLLDDRRQLFEDIARRRPSARLIVGRIQEDLGWLLLCRVNEAVRKTPTRKIPTINELFCQLGGVDHAYLMLHSVLTLIETACDTRDKASP